MSGHSGGCLTDGEVRDFLLDEFDALLADPHFVDRITWLLPPNDVQSRYEIVLERMKKIAGL